MEFNKKTKMSTAKPTEFSCILKVSKPQLGTKPYQVTKLWRSETECIRETVKTTLLEQDPPYHKKDGVLVALPPFYQTLKLRKRFKPPWIVSLTMQASCKQNINDSFQILRPINFVHVVHQLGGVLYNPPTTKHGGSSSSALVKLRPLPRLGAVPGNGHQSEYIRALALVRTTFHQRPLYLLSYKLLKQSPLFS